MAMSRAEGRLSPEQIEKVKKNATAFQQNLVLKAKGKVEGRRAEGGVFFSTLFRLAGESIENDVNGFCDKADAVFEEIEAYGQEPQLDGDWLGKIVGDRDTFNFSTDNLVSDLVSPTRKGRRKKQLTQEERDRLKHEVEKAILDDDVTPQDYQQAIAVAHAENVADWIETIKRALNESEAGILEFWTLKERTGLYPAELFLGLLLGHENWCIRQNGFYSEITVEGKID